MKRGYQAREKVTQMSDAEKSDAYSMPSAGKGDADTKRGKEWCGRQAR